MLPKAVALLVLTALTHAPAAPFIAEFQAENRDTIRDADGDTSDWLEIYNPDSTAVDLTGMALTDDALAPQKWVFPAVTIAPRSSLLVWCSGKNRRIPSQPLHTNFDLASAGEYLALIAADGTTRLSEWSPFPAQYEDRSYGGTYPAISQTVIPTAAPCRWLVPSSTVANWQALAFVDTAWNAGVTGIGYDRSASDGDYLPLIGAGGNTESGMFQIRTSCYIRIPFTVTEATAVNSLLLRVKYEDGFAAFLNGTRLNPPTPAQTNAPASLTATSPATAVRSNADAVIYAPFDLSAQKSLLVEGTNVLAVQLMNQATTSSDLLFMPELSLTKTDINAVPVYGFFPNPTPGTNNTGTTVNGFVDAPDFSIKRGFQTAPVSVTLTTKTPGAQIRYTTNGSAPTATTGTAYTAPVTVSSSSVLRAAAFLNGWLPSTVKSHSYIFASQVPSQPAAPAGYPTTWGNEYNFTTGVLSGATVPADYRMDPLITGNATYGPLIVPALTTTLPIVSLSGDITQIFGSANGIYSNGRLTAGLELATSIEFWDPAGTADWQENIGLRMHGGDAPIEHPKKPFRVYFRKTYGTDRLRQPLFPGSPVESFDKLQLRPGGHDGWAVPFGSGNESLARHATYCRDRFLRQTELDMGRLAHRGRYVHLYINGLYWGFYDLHEVQSKEMFSDHMGGEEEDWDVVEQTGAANPLFDVVDGTSTAMDSTLALVRPPTNAASSATYTALSEYIDYNDLIDNLIVQMWGAQNDWMGPVFRGVPGVNLTDASRFFNKNWQAGRRSRGLLTAGFLWQTWDAEISMGNSLTSLVSTMRVSDFNHTLIGTPVADIPHVAGTPGPPAEIYYALRKYSAPFRIKFADRLQKHFFNDGVMTVAANQARMQSFRNLLDLPIVPESARWGDVNTGDPITVAFNRDEHWRSEMDWLKNTYIPGRNTTLLSQFRAIGLWPSVTAPTLSQHGGTVPAGYQLSITDLNAAGGTVYYTLDGSDPMGAVPDTSTQTLIGPGRPGSAKYKVPASGYAKNAWKNISPPADIASWQTGAASLGFGGAAFAPHIETTVTGMQGVGTSLYVRLPFQVTAAQKAAMTSLTLKLKYDDGAYVFLNGSVPLHRLNAPTTSPLYTSKAVADRASADAVTAQTLDLTGQISSLTTEGDNLLAIQGLNFDSETIAGLEDTDFLCAAELTATIATPPGIAAGAIAYNGAFPLPGSGTVKARVLQNGVWSPLTEASFIAGVPAAAGNLLISEFSYNPVASPEEMTGGFTDQQFEFIELLNISSSPVELSGCLFDAGISFDFTSSTIKTLAPGARLLLASDAAGFTLRHPGVSIAGVFANSSALSNGGERLRLLSAAGTPVFDFVYDDVAPWPVSPDGNGSTLVLINPMAGPDPGVGSNWRASTAPGGSPGGSDADTYAAWASRNSVAGTALEDDNANGLTNLAEYALSAGPESFSGILSAGFETVDPGSGSDTYLVLRYRRNAAADDVVVTPEMSTDLTHWAPMTDTVEPTGPPIPGIENVARRSPLPVSLTVRTYVRLTVTTR